MFWNAVKWQCVELKMWCVMDFPSLPLQNLNVAIWDTSWFFLLLCKQIVFRVQSKQPIIVGGKNQGCSLRSLGYRKVNSILYSFKYTSGLRQLFLSSADVKTGVRSYTLMLLKNINLWNNQCSLTVYNFLWSYVGCIYTFPLFPCT